jgi:hypothetical protein
MQENGMRPTATISSILQSAVCNPRFLCLAEIIVHEIQVPQNTPITQGTIGTPPILAGAQVTGTGAFQFSLTNIETASLTVLASTNFSLPLSNWVVVGAASNIGPGQFEFTSPPNTNDTQVFYTVRSP